MWSAQGKNLVGKTNMAILVLSDKQLSKSDSKIEASFSNYVSDTIKFKLDDKMIKGAS